MESIPAGFLGWLLRASWQASILVLIVLVLQWAFQKKSTAGFRHALWLVVLTRLLLPVSPTSTLSIFNIARFGTGAVVSSDQNSPPITIARVPSAEAIDPPAQESLNRVNEPLDTAQNQHALALTTVGSTPSAERVSVFKGQNLISLLGLLWAIGVFFLSLRIAVQNIRFAFRLRVSKRIVSPEIIGIFDECRKRLGIHRHINLAKSDAVLSPALYGFFRPILLLPEKVISDFNDQELRYIFLHELGHVKRCDMMLHWVATSAKVLHWFNPILWFAFRRMAADRELACDELALSQTKEKEYRPYAETIIKLLENCVRPERLPGLMGILEDKNQMAQRITRIASFKHNSRWSIFGFVVLPLLALVSLTDAQNPKTDQKVQGVNAQSERSNPDTKGLEQAGPWRSLNPSLPGQSKEELLAQINFRKGLNDKAFVKAVDAFKEMGETALPFLREKLAATKPLSERKTAAEERRSATWVLKELGPVAAPAIPELISTMADGDPAICASAAMALGEIGRKARSAVPALVEAVRFGIGQAAIALVQIEPDNPALVPLFIEMLKTSTSDSRYASGQSGINAVQALHRLGPRAKAAIPILREALADPGLKIYAAYALRRVAPDRPELLAEANSILKVTETAVPDINDLVEQAEKATVANRHRAFSKLHHGLETAKRQGVAVSEDMIQNRIVPLVKQLVDGGDPKDVRSVVWVLGDIGDSAKPFIPALIQFLENNDLVERGNAVGVLSRIGRGDPRTLPVLIRLLNDWHQGLRGNACNSLAEFGPEAKDAIPALHQRLNQREPHWVRFNATLALWRIARESPSLSVLQEALQGDSGGDWVPLRSLEMLSGLSRQTDQSVALLRDLAQNWNPEVRTNAQALLGKLGEKAQIPSPK